MPSLHMTKPMWLSGDIGSGRSGHFEILAAHIKAQERSATIAGWRIANRSAAAAEMILSALQEHFDNVARKSLDALTLYPG